MSADQLLTLASTLVATPSAIAQAWRAPSGEIAMGVLTGVIFGFLLQRAHVTRYSTIVGQFLLKDFTVLKVMGTAIVVGVIGIFGMKAIGMDFPMHVKSATLLANALGGLIFGVGMVVLGYCPGTGIAAIGDGSRHAIPGLAGMIVGAALYAELYPWIRRVILPVGDMGKVTLPDITGSPAWLLIAALIAMAAGGFYALERINRTRSPQPG